MNWAMVSAIGSMSGLMGAIFIFATRAIVRDEIAKLDERYLSKQRGETKFEEIERRLEILGEIRRGKGSSGSHRALSAGAD